MSVRDAQIWATEARRKMLQREVESFNLALLPHQRPDKIREEADRLRVRLMEEDVDVSIEQVEKENLELMERSKARAAEILARRRARGQGKKKPAGPSKRGRYIR